MTTTMKISVDVRDRLAELASQHGRPLGAELAALVAAAEEREWWHNAADAAARPGADPDQWADYLAETAAPVAAHVACDRCCLSG